MSEEYTHVGTVRRRPRSGHQTGHQTGYQHSQSSGRNGKANSNGGPNGHSNAYAESGSSARRDRQGRREFERESYYDRAPENEPRGPKFDERRRSRLTEEERKALPYYNDPDEEPLFRFPFDPWRLYGAVKRNLGWIVCAGALLGLIGFFFAAYMVQYKINIPLIRQTSNAVRTENMPMEFMPHQYSEQTLYSFMTAGQVLQNVAEKAKLDPRLAPLNVTPEQLASSLSVKPTPNPDIVLATMEVFGGLRAMVDLANLYGHEVVSFMREVQRREAGKIREVLESQLAQANSNIAQLTVELGEYSDTGVMPFDKETSTEIQNLMELEADLQSTRSRLQMLDEQIKFLGGGSDAPKTRLDQEREKLDKLLVDYTPRHTLVLQQKDLIARLEARPDKGGPAETLAAGAPANPFQVKVREFEAERVGLEKKVPTLTNQIAQLKSRLGSQSGKNIDYQIKAQRMEWQKKARDVLAERERQARQFYEGSLGYFGLHSPPTLESINYKSRWVKVSLLAMFAAGVGVFFAVGLVMLTEMMDTTLRTAEDITRVTALPVLASLGDLRKMSAQQQVNWAFRTLTLLKGKLSRNADQALVCGIISANHREGRSTWVNLLVSAASQRGLRVLTVDTRPTAAGPEGEPAREPKSEPAPAPAPAPKAESAAPAEKKETENGQVINLPDAPPEAPGTNVLSSPAKVAEQLSDPNSQSLVHIPLPGWVWSLERRKQWQQALEHWKDIDNLVIFVELPPACEQESVLLAEHLPQCIWLTGSGMADATETAAHLETLRHARCNLVGAVLNYAPPPFLSNKITRWFAKSATALLLCASMQSGSAAEDATLAVERSAAPFETRLNQIEARVEAAAKEEQPSAEVQFAVTQANETPADEPQAAESLSFGANPGRTRAKWQERLTFGPGDIIDIHFFGNTALSRTNVLVGPDGRINYLEATSVVATGLTVEELREKLDTLLREFDPDARTIVVPVAYNSKKYFMLGKVNAKGAYPLDRPLTLLEAVARAKGLETGLYRRTTVEMADLGRSFIVRGNEKLPVDFEQLFYDGDLSQNIVIEPGDYIYFASTGANDIYVLGEVTNPGPLGFVQSATVMTAIADRGGYSVKAYKRRVLVIRGSLEEPETFVVDTGGTLDARHRDFRLEPRDIVYVSRRPWVKAEELLDEAASSFIQGMVTTWAGVNVGPIITKRLLPRARNQ